MRILVVLDHPYTIASAENVPHRRSFSAAVAAAAIRGARSAGHEVDLIDLAADGFQPAMTREDLAAWRQGRAVDPQVPDYQQRLLAAGHLAFVFPVWWEAMPAATKGFLDRVLTKGVMYEELPGAKGNPFRNRMTQPRRGQRPVDHDHAGQGLPLVVPRPAHQDPVQGHLRQDRHQEPPLDQLRQRHRQDPRTTRPDASADRAGLRGAVTAPRHNDAVRNFGRNRRLQIAGGASRSGPGAR